MDWGFFLNHKRLNNSNNKEAKQLPEGWKSTHPTTSVSHSRQHEEIVTKNQTVTMVVAIAILEPYRHYPFVRTVDPPHRHRSYLVGFQQ